MLWRKKIELLQVKKLDNDRKVIYKPITIIKRKRSYYYIY